MTKDEFLKTFQNMYWYPRFLQAWKTERLQHNSMTFPGLPWLWEPWQPTLLIISAECSLGCVTLAAQQVAETLCTVPHWPVACLREISTKIPPHAWTGINIPWLREAISAFLDLTYSSTLTFLQSSFILFYPFIISCSLLLFMESTLNSLYVWKVWN